MDAYFPVSAVTGEGVGAMVEVIVERRPGGLPLYPDDTVTKVTEAIVTAELGLVQRLARPSERRVYVPAARVVGAGTTAWRYERGAWTEASTSWKSNDEWVWREELRNNGYQPDPSIRLFFFSSRRRHTRSLCDWIQTCALPICQLGVDDRGIVNLRLTHEPTEHQSRRPDRPPRPGTPRRHRPGPHQRGPTARPDPGRCRRSARSEERRVGKECRARWSAYHKKKK